MIELISSLDLKYVLKKDKAAGPLRCHLCDNPVASNCDKIRLHYLKSHRVTVSVIIDYPPPTHPLAAGGNPTTALSAPGLDGLGSSNRHAVMDVDNSVADYTPEDCSIGDNLVEPDDEPADSWELDTVYSDFSDGVLENGPEDQVVPLSFTLPSSATPPTENEGEDLTPPLDSQDSPSRLVYGSGSRYFSTSGLPVSHHLLI